MFMLQLEQKKCQDLQLIVIHAYNVELNHLFGACFYINKVLIKLLLSTVIQYSTISNKQIPFLGVGVEPKHIFFGRSL